MMIEVEVQDSYEAAALRQVTSSPEMLLRAASYATMSQLLELPVEETAT